MYTNTITETLYEIEQLVKKQNYTSQYMILILKFFFMVRNYSEDAIIVILKILLKKKIISESFFY